MNALSSFPPPSSSSSSFSSSSSAAEVDATEMTCKINRTTDEVFVLVIQETMREQSNRYDAPVFCLLKARSWAEADCSEKGKAEVAEGTAAGGEEECEGICG